MYVEYFKLATWLVVEASDGPEALAIALSRRPDVIIADSYLPRISGCDLCEVLRGDPATRATPIILVTSDVAARQLQRARASGATSVMMKPCLPDALLNEAVRLLDEFRACEHPIAAPGVMSAPSSLERGGDEGLRPSRRMSHTHLRGKTDLPPSSPPALICPDCDSALEYRSSEVGGVSVRNAEQWDYFVCANGCGTFQHRQRTRKVRRVS
jgi:CheY-like chemotaxis protein